MTDDLDISLSMEDLLVDLDEKVAEDASLDTMVHSK